MGVGAIQGRRSHQASGNRLQEGLPRMPYSRAVDGLDLRQRLSGSRFKVRKIVRSKPSSKRFQGGCAMRRIIAVLTLGLGVVAASLLPHYSRRVAAAPQTTAVFDAEGRSEEHTSELQSPVHLVC